MIFAVLRSSLRFFGACVLRLFFGRVGGFLLFCALRLCGLVRGRVGDLLLFSAFVNAKQCAVVDVHVLCSSLDFCAFPANVGLALSDGLTCSCCLSGRCRSSRCRCPSCCRR